MTKQQRAEYFRLLGDENRLTIIELLKPGEKCACELLGDLKISQPTLSHHMKLLSDADLVSLRKEGKWTHYTLNTELLKEVFQWV